MQEFVLFHLLGYSVCSLVFMLCSCNHKGLNFIRPVLTVKSGYNEHWEIKNLFAITIVLNIFKQFNFERKRHIFLLGITNNLFYPNSLYQEFTRNT